MPQDLFQNADMMRKFAAIATSGGSHADAFDAFLGVLKDAGVGQSAIEEAQAIGPKLLKKKVLPKSVKALAGGLEASQLVDQAFDVARQTTQGIPDHIITSEWKRAIQKSGGPLAQRLKDVPSDVVLRAVKGGGFTGGPNTPIPSAGGPLAVRRAAGGELATVAKVGREAAAETGIKAVAKSGLKGMLKGTGAGFALNMLLPFGAASPLTLPFREGRARSKAVEGFAAMGASSSGEVLSSIVRQQELASRRQMVLQQFEPEMFQRMLTSLAMNEQPPSAVTPTERRIGGETPYEETLPARRPDKDVKFLLDQLMNEMSGSL